MGSSKEICLICLKNSYDDKTLLLFDLTTMEWENVTYLNKLEYVLNAEIMLSESTLICNECVNDLNHAFNFKEKVTSALEYWALRCEETIAIDNRPIENTVSFEGEAEPEAGLNNYMDEKSNEISVDNNKISEPVNTEALINDNKTEVDKCSTFPCTKCNCVFPTASELLYHSCETTNVNESIEVENEAKEEEEEPDGNKYLTEKKSDTFFCDLCEITFTKRWLLNKHIKAHTEGKKYICKYCNRGFKQSYHLREHETIHTGEHNYMCSVCGKTFQRISSQKRHMRAHDALPGEKSKKSPFLCTICGKWFPYSNGEQRHMRTHTNERNHECKICNKKFGQSSHLNIHLRTHTGERPYRCKLCGDTFSIKASLDKHKKAHENSKNDVKILHNLEPNLSQTELRKKVELNNDEYIVEELPLYEQGYLITYNQ